MSKQFSPANRITLALFCTATLFCAAAAPELNVIQRNGFELRCPAAFEEDHDPAADVLFASGMLHQVDQRQLPWETNIIIHLTPANKIAGASPDERMQTVADNLKTRFSNQLAEDPTIENIDVPNCAAARVLRYRYRTGGQQERNYDLFVFSGDQVYRVMGLVRAYAGSEVLSPDGEQMKQLTAAVLSFRLVPPNATQPATTKASAP